MADSTETIESVSYINPGDNQNHPIDAVTLGGKSSTEFQINNLVTTIDENSTDTQYPSAKCIWDKLNSSDSVQLVMSDDGSVSCIKNSTDNIFTMTDDGSITLL